MKKTLVPGLLILCAFCIYWSGCGNNVDPLLNEQQKAAKTMQEGSPWGGAGKVEVLTVPTGVLEGDLELLSLTFGTSGDPEWVPSSIVASGADNYFSTDNATWRWGTATGTDVIGLTGASSSEFTSVEAQDQQIRFSFEINSSGGRIEGIDGSYSVILSRN